MQSLGKIEQRLPAVEAKIWCLYVSFFIFLSVCHAPVRWRAIRLRGTYFDQVLCHGLWVDFD